MPRPRVERGGRVSPASSSRTSTSPARSTDSVLGWEGDYDQSFPNMATYPARDRGRVSYPPHPDYTRRYPVPDRGRARHSEWSGGGGGGRLLVGDRDRERQYRPSPGGRYPAGPDRQSGRQSDPFSAGRHPGGSADREKPRTSSPRDRHVRISPYPVEEIPREMPRSTSHHFPTGAPERDRRDRSASPASSGTPQSILAKHSRDRARAQQSGPPPPDMARPTPRDTRHQQQQQQQQQPGATPPPADPGYVRSHSAEGVREYRERSWGPEDEAARQAVRPRALTEPTNHRPAAWARPHADREAGPPRGQIGRAHV